MSRRLGTRQGFGRYYDWSRGIIGGTTDKALSPRHLKRSDNVLGRPYRAMGTVRGGTREVQDSPLNDEPTSIAKLVPTTGANRLVIHVKDSASVGVGKLLSVTPGVPGTTVLTPPVGYTVTDQDMESASLNGTLFMTIRGNTQGPIMFERYAVGGLYELDMVKLAVPGQTLTFVAGNTGGIVDVGLHWWRIRYEYRNGVSKNGPAFPLGGQNVAAPNQTITIGNLLDPTLTGRQDWTAWTIERTKVGAPATGGGSSVPTAQARWYFVARGTTATYDDKFADADLFYVSDEGVFGDPPHVEGLIAHKDRLFGWSGSDIFVSQAVGDIQGTGPCDWDAELVYPVGSDDGDTIQAVQIQSDRLLIWKTRSIHALEGSDPDSFRIFEIASGLGAVGPRAATVVGNVGYALGESGLNRIVGNRAEPWGEVEIGHYLADLNQAADERVKAINLAGEFLLMAYPAVDSAFNNEVIVYDFQVREFRHYTHLRIRDALIQEDNAGDFNGVTMIFVDPVRVALSSTDVVIGEAINFTSWRGSDAGSIAQIFVGAFDAAGGRAFPASGIQVSAQISGGSTSTPESQVCPDDLGGNFVAFTDRRSGVDQVYVQHVLDDGTLDPAWPVGGLVIRSGLTGHCTEIAIAPNGAGGCHVAWEDARSAGAEKPFAQSVNANATVNWTANGVQLSTFAGGNIILNISILPDFATGGAIYVWNVSDAGDAYGQRLNGSGALQWVATGVALDTSIYVLDRPGIVSDGSGGFYLAVDGGSNIELWRFDAAGVAVAGWATPLALDASASVGVPVIVRSGASAVIVLWVQWDNPNFALWGQKVGSDRTIKWAAGGVQLTPFNLDGVANLAAVADDDEGVLFAWQPGAPGGGGTVRAQKVDKDGLTQWGADGVPVYSIITSIDHVSVASDAAGGFYIVWDQSTGTQVAAAQWIDPNGVPLWATDGVLLSDRSGTNNNPRIAPRLAENPALDPISLAAAFRIWGAFVGTKDEVLSDGTGGTKIPIRTLTPFLDDGAPEQFKSLERIHVAGSGETASLTLTLRVESGAEAGERVVSSELHVEGSGFLWGDDADLIGPDDLVWASDDGSVGGDWATDESAFLPPIPFPQGTRGLSYAVEISGDVDDVLTLEGFTIDGVLEPERRLS